MNISLNNNDALSGVLKIEIEKKDYEDSVEKDLRQVRRKANAPGFRKGMVPMSMVKKMYGVQALMEELNKIVVESMTTYMKENQISVLGEPISNEAQKKVDWENDENFEFVFDLAYRPEIEVKLSKEDKLTYYKIKVDDEAVDRQIDSYASGYGTYEQAEKSEEGDELEGLLVEFADGEPKPEGIMVEKAIVIPKYMKGKTERKKFVGAGVGKKIIFNPFKAYKGSSADLALLLKIKETETKGIKSDFSFEVRTITHHKKAELNRELFDKIYGEGVVKDETEFREKTKVLLSEQYAPESDYRFMEDFRNLLLNKMENITFADDILKRWILVASEDKTEEDVEREYLWISDDLKYQLVREKLVRDFGITVEKYDVINIAERICKAQFIRYGIVPVADMLVNYVEKMLEKQETVKDFTERVISEKLTEAAKERISVEEKEVTSAEFFNIDNVETKESEIKD
jgi:trigger factor